MTQEDINKDLGSYIKERKDKPFWKKYASRQIKPKETEEEIQARVNAELKQDIDKIAEKEEKKILPEDKKELEKEEHKIEEINTIEEKVEDEIEVEHEGALKKFFKKLHFSKKKDESDENIMEASDDESEEDTEEKEENTKEKLSDEEEELKELLRTIHDWIVQLPPEKLEEFKKSKDFELYTKYLRKHNLIR